MVKRELNSARALSLSLSRPFVRSTRGLFVYFEFSCRWRWVLDYTWNAKSRPVYKILKITQGEKEI